MEQACVGCDLKQMDKVSTLLHLTKLHPEVLFLHFRAHRLYLKKPFGLQYLVPQH